MVAVSGGLWWRQLWLRRRSFFFSPLLRCVVFFLCFSFSLSTRFHPSLQWMCGLPPVCSGSQWRGRGTAAAAVVFFSSPCVLPLSTTSSSLCRGCAADSSQCWWQSGKWRSCLVGNSPSLLNVVLCFWPSLFLTVQGLLSMTGRTVAAGGDDDGDGAAAAASNG